MTLAYSHSCYTHPFRHAKYMEKIMSVPFSKRRDALPAGPPLDFHRFRHRNEKVSIPGRKTVILRPLWIVGVSPFDPAIADDSGHVVHLGEPRFTARWTMNPETIAAIARPDFHDEDLGIVLYEALSADGTSTGSHDVSASAYGFAMGIDYQNTRGATLGFAFSGGGTSWNLSDGLGGGTSQDYQFGLNGTMHREKVYAMAALAYGFHHTSTERHVPGGDLLTAGFDGHSLSGRIESGARFKAQMGSFITPYAALQAQAYFVPGYDEDDPGGSGFALSYNERVSTSTRAEFGVRLDHDLRLDDATRLNLGARLAYAHDWFDDSALGASFQALPGARFIVNGAAPPANLGLTSLDAELILDYGLSLLARFEGAFAPGATSLAGIGSIRWRW